MIEIDKKGESRRGNTRVFDGGKSDDIFAIINSRRTKKKLSYLHNLTNQFPALDFSQIHLLYIFCHTFPNSKLELRISVLIGKVELKLHFAVCAASQCYENKNFQAFMIIL